MSLGFYLLATVRAASASPDALADRVHGWLAKRFGARVTRRGLTGNNRAAAFAKLHPAAEELELIALDDHRLTASASTSTVGPGYHAWLVDRLDELAAALDLAWEPPTEDDSIGDETGYFDKRDYAALEHAMLMWLRALCSNLVGFDQTEFDVCLSMDRGFRLPAFARTPLGPRDRDWFLGVADDPRRGVDFFAWWERGEGAGYFAGKAEALMWTEVTWRKPVCDAERDVLEDVAQCLATALRLDPSRDYRWREWADILGYLEVQGATRDWVEMRSASSAGAPLVGYRRYPVRVSLGGGWSLLIPGEFAEEWDDDGTFCAWFEGRTIWFTGFKKRNAEHATPEEVLGSERSDSNAERFERSENGLLGRASLSKVEEDEDVYFQLSTESAVPPRLAQCTICFHDPAHREWALGVWRSLKNGRAGQSSTE